MNTLFREHSGTQVSWNLFPKMLAQNSITIFVISFHSLCFCDAYKVPNSAAQHFCTLLLKRNNFTVLQQQNFISRYPILICLLFEQVCCLWIFHTLLLFQNVNVLLVFCLLLILHSITTVNQCNVVCYLAPQAKRKQYIPYTNHGTRQPLADRNTLMKTWSNLNKKASHLQSLFHS